MVNTRFKAGESPEMLSARVGRPLCAILRANKLYSAAWLMPDMLINVPDMQFCARDAFACPVKALRAPAVHMRAYAMGEGESAHMAARALGVTPRIIYALAGASGEPIRRNTALTLPEVPSDYSVITVMPLDTFETLCAGEDEVKLRTLNAVWGHIYPGMKLLVPARRTRAINPKP